MKPLPLLLLMLISITSLCQDSSIFNKLDKYYALSVEKLRDLHQGKRAVVMSECDETAPVSFTLKRIFETYKGRKVGVMFYSFTKDTLRIWLQKANDPKIYHSESLISRTRLIDLEVSLRNSMRVDLLLASRNNANRSSITKKDHGKSRLTFEQAARNATKVLFPPEIASGLNGIEHLMIASEFNISQFPFYTLKPFKNNAYLVDSFSVSLVPHLCNFENYIGESEDKKSLIGTKVKAHFDNPLVVGNPFYTKNPRYSLTQLPGAELEAKEVARILKTQPLIGNNATYSAVINRSQNSDLLYFATHGFFDFENLLDSSFLAFAPDKTNATGLWTARKIQQTSFRNTLGNLAVLSACQTGVGKVYEGGFIGIGRAFYIGGIDNTIMSLWSVDDKATKKLMTSFIKKLTAEEEYFYPAGHLRKAVLEFKKTNPDPAKWAPFMVFGFTY